MKTNIQQAAAAMGKKGGAAKTEAKKAASRSNGKKGGRPRKGIQTGAVEIYKDDDGWWAILPAGWTVDGCYGAREDTKRRLLERLKDAVQSPGK